MRAKSNILLIVVNIFFLCSCKPQNVAQSRSSVKSTSSGASECTFAFSPVPQQKNDGSRGSTYSGHGSARDYGISEGTELYALGGCSVTWTNNDGSGSCGYGMSFNCDVANESMKITYCHMVEAPVQERSLGMGDVAGYSGNTGNSTGPHLHLGMKYSDGSGVEDNNPDQWLDERGCYDGTPRKPQGQSGKTSQTNKQTGNTSGKASGNSQGNSQSGKNKQVKAQAIEPVYMETTASSLNLRQGPSTNTPIISSYPRGDIVTAFEKYQEWYHVRTEDENIGWMHGRYLRKAEDQEDDEGDDEWGSQDMQDSSNYTE